MWSQDQLGNRDVHRSILAGEYANQPTIRSEFEEFDPQEISRRREERLKRKLEERRTGVEEGDTRDSKFTATPRKRKKLAGKKKKDQENQHFLLYDEEEGRSSRPLRRKKRRDQDMWDDAEW